MTIRERHFFHPLDYVLLVLSLLTSLGVGIYQVVRARNDQTTNEYLMGGRKFGVLPVAMSLIASFISSIALIGLPAEAHFYGIHTIFSFIGLFAATMFSAYFFVPLFHPLKITSVQEYLELRFHSKSLRLFGTFICVISQLFYTGCVVYGQAAALEATTGLPYWASILLVNVLGTIYTAFGGMKAVIWTDVFQVTVMFFSMICVIAIGMARVGGFARVWEMNTDWGRFELKWNLGIYTRMTFWSMMIASWVGWTNTYSVSQTAVQRYCAVSDVKKARSSMVLNAFGTAFFCIVCVVVGTVTFAYYVFVDCDPYADGQITNKNQILPFFIMDLLSYPGVPGLFVSGLFSGSLSTISSNINSMSAVIWEDIFSGRIGHKMTSARQVTFNKCIAGCVGVAGLGMTFMVHNIGGSLLQIAKSLFGLCSGPSLGVFILGVAFPWANWIGALSGGIISLAFVLWMFIGQLFLGNLSESLPLPSGSCHANSTLNMTSMTSTFATSTQPTTDIFTETGGSMLDEWFYSISFMWYGVVGIITCIVVGLVVSFLTGATDPSTVEKRLLISFISKYFGRESDEKQKLEQTSYPLLAVKEKQVLATTVSNSTPPA